MKTLTFYYQKRRDGGLRAGVELDNERILERFDPGSSHADSALLWWIDLRCSQETWPNEPEEVRAWLLESENVGKIENGLANLASELRAGIDVDWPAQHVVPGPAGTKIEILCSAMRRVEGHEIESVLLDLARNWQTIIASLPSYEPAVAH